MAFGTSFVPIESFGESLGYLSLGSLTGQMFGPQLGSMIADKWGVDVNFLVAASFNFNAITIINFLPYRFEKKEAVRKKVTVNDFFAAELLVYVILVAVLSLGNGC